MVAVIEATLTVGVHGLPVRHHQRAAGLHHGTARSEPATSHRPRHFFDPDTPTWPETLELRLELPTALEIDYGASLTRQRVAERVRIRERRAWQESKRTGIAFVGPRRVLKLAHTKRARSYEAFGALNPQFATAGHRAVATEAVRRLRAFHTQYEDALRRWMEGDRTALFPEGTWWMRVCHGARCGPAP